MSKPLAHADLVVHACRWLKRERGCKIVFAEYRSWLVDEQPDALGFCAHRRRWSDPPGKRLSVESHVVECKTSRSDFAADAKKPHRQGAGMGVFRWYMTPAGLLSPSELPPLWGLLELSDRRARLVVNAHAHPDRDEGAELRTLFTAVQRAHMGIPWFSREYRFETVREGSARKRQAVRDKQAARRRERGKK